MEIFGCTKDPHIERMGVAGWMFVYPFIFCVSVLYIVIAYMNFVFAFKIGKLYLCGVCVSLYVFVYVCLGDNKSADFKENANFSPLMFSRS